MDLAALASDLEAERHMSQGRSGSRSTLAGALERSLSPLHAERHRGGDRDRDGSGASSPTPAEPSRAASFVETPEGTTPTGANARPPRSSRSRSRLDAFSPTNSSTSSALGALHSKYEVFDAEEVGHGAYGVVVKGRSRQTGDFVAIKRISKSRVSTRSLTELQGEVETLSLVGNHYTIKLVDVFEDDRHLLIVMDYVPGGNLSNALKKVGSFSEVSVRRFAFCLLNAIEFVHGRGVVHRDLKPANCLLAEDIFSAGSTAKSEIDADHDSPRSSGDDDLPPPNKRIADVKIADFGFAVMVGNDQCLTNFCGTTSYMAPEIISSLSRPTNYGKEVDLWSIGVMLFALLSGDLPFHGNSGDELATAVSRGSYSMAGQEWSHVSSAAKDLINQMLVVNPNRRVTARGALNHPWIRSAYAEGAAAMEYPQGLPRSLSTYFNQKHRPVRARLKGAVVLVLAAHRLLFLRKCAALRKEGLGDIQLFRNFSYLVGSRYNPPSHAVVAGKQCAANPKAIRHLADMVEASDTVETFDVSSTLIDNVDVVQHIVKVSVCHPSLLVLNLEDNPIPSLAGRALIRLARKASKLMTINVNRTALGQDAIDQISHDLKENERKRHLDASNSASFSSTGGSLYPQYVVSPLLSPSQTSGNSSFAGSPLTSPPGGRASPFSGSSVSSGGPGGRGRGAYALPPAMMSAPFSDASPMHRSSSSSSIPRYSSNTSNNSRVNASRTVQRNLMGALQQPPPTSSTPPPGRTVRRSHSSTQMVPRGTSSTPNPTISDRSGLPPLQSRNPSRNLR